MEVLVGVAACSGSVLTPRFGVPCRRATTRPACQPGARPPARAERIASTSRPLRTSEPGDERVRVPHLPCVQLVPSPDRRCGYISETRSRTRLRDAWIVRQPLRAFDGVPRDPGSRRHASVGPRTGTRETNLSPAGCRLHLRRPRRAAPRFHPGIGHVISITNCPLGQVDRERGVIEAFWACACGAEPPPPRKARPFSRTKRPPAPSGSHQRSTLGTQLMLEVSRADSAAAIGIRADSRCGKAAAKSPEGRAPVRRGKSQREEFEQPVAAS